MIASVRGPVAVRRPDHVVVDVGGVGYRLSVSDQTLRQVPAIGSEVSLHTHLVPRDDALVLYGFATEEERDLFLQLVTVSGIGPKVALAILSGQSPRELIRLIAAGDAAAFRKAPGVGRKTAERIIVELREKVVPPDAAPEAPADAEGPPDVRREAVDGLVGLGYEEAEAIALLDEAVGERPEELIAHALKRAGRARAGEK